MFALVILFGLLARAFLAVELFAFFGLDLCATSVAFFGALAFFAVGYGIAYGTDAGSLFGVDTFFLSGAESGFSAEGASASSLTSSSRWSLRPPP